MFGWGTTSNTPDFFGRAAGPGFGFELGLKLLVFDLSVSFLQIIDGDGLSGTLTPGPVRGGDRHPGRAHAKLDERRRASTSCTPGDRRRRRAGDRRAASVRRSTNEQLADKGFVVALPLRLRVLLEPVHGRRRPRLDFGYHYFLGGQAVNNSAGPLVRLSTSWRWRTSPSTSALLGRLRWQRRSAARRAARGSQIGLGQVDRRRCLARIVRRRARRRGPRAGCRRRTCGLISPSAGSSSRVRQVDAQEREAGASASATSRLGEDLDVQLLARQAPVGGEVDQHRAPGRARVAPAPAVSSDSQASWMSPLGVSR